MLEPSLHRRWHTVLDILCRVRLSSLVNRLSSNDLCYWFEYAADVM